jgi:hypothetical protein
LNRIFLIRYEGVVLNRKGLHRGSTRARHSVHRA